MNKLYAILSIITFLTGFSFCASTESIYKREATITFVDREEREIEAVDLSGNFWSFYGTGFEVGEEVTLIMDDNHTINVITDDIIKDVHKR